MKIRIDKNTRKRIIKYVTDRLETEDEKASAFDFINENYYPDEDGINDLIEKLKEKFGIDFSDWGKSRKKKELEENENIIIKFSEETKSEKFLKAYGLIQLGLTNIGYTIKVIL
ncbi:MAG: hypothetical protein ACTSVB_09250 [Candidatus Heimdallarchaeaceae archaeon]